MRTRPGGQFGASFEADRRLTIVETLLAEHVRQCDRRGAALARLAWLGLGINFAILGSLLKLALHL